LIELLGLSPIKPIDAEEDLGFGQLSGDMGEPLLTVHADTIVLWNPAA
jgi:hypothetical protein